MPCAESESDSISTFDFLPDALVLLIFDRIADTKTLSHCALVSRRLRSLSRQVHSVLVKLDHLTSKDEATKSSHLCGRIFVKHHSADRGSKTPHHSPAHMLKNFNEIKHLRIELQNPELELDNASFIKWSASFGSMLTNFVILAATTVLRPDCTNVTTIAESTKDSSTIPETFYINGELKSRVVWTISSLVAASARHYSLNPIITKHKNLEKIIVNDASGQGVLRMSKKQLEEMRAIQPSLSCSTKRVIMPDLEMRLWYAHRMVLGDGSVLVGATLGVIRPRGKVAYKEEFLDGDSVGNAFEELFASAAKVMVKGRCYSVNMDSF